MAMRHVVSESTVSFDPRARTFGMILPEEILENETNRERIEYMWERFEAAVTQLCKARNSLLLMKNRSKSLFHNSMDKLCLDFSRRTETIIVKFEVHRDDKKNRTTKKKKQRKVYVLKFVQLNEIPEECRNAPYFTVERLREEPPQVHAEFVSNYEAHDCDNNPQLVRVEDLSSGLVSDEAEILQSLPSTRMGEIVAASTLAQSYDYNDNYVNPPIAAAAAVVETIVLPLERSYSSSSLELLPVVTVL